MSRFPHHEPFEVAGHALDADSVIEILEPQLTDARRERIHEVVQGRTYSVVPVLDGIYDRGNISAVMRSAEALGFQKMHLIETQEGFKVANRVTQGTDKWLDVERWEQPSECGERLRAQGYQIVVTHLEAARPICEVDFTRPTAIVFGNERDGVSEELVAMADCATIIPMSGFAQSFNISVAAAIAFYHIKTERDRNGCHADLSEVQKRLLKANYYVRSVRSPEAHVARALGSSEGV